ncbi:MAG: adenylylsulfate kinase [Puniceicoccaceae bacterium 5H]|nr:MAG: adenylylsulfate kinase [Puniceicoccaceae bacterium 5H]
MFPEMAENIYPEFERMLRREDKERLLGQRGVVVWLYGLSGSGKSTIANAFERLLHSRGKLTQILDGDNIRSGLNSNLGFTDEDRQENIRRIAEVSKLYLNTGVITLCSFITPRRELRRAAKEIVGQGDFVEVYVRASFETCAERDPKGLYAKVQAGQVANFTGKDSMFEEPEADEADLILDTEAHELPVCVEQLEQFLRERSLI